MFRPAILLALAGALVPAATANAQFVSGSVRVVGLSVGGFVAAPSPVVVTSYSPAVVAGPVFVRPAPVVIAPAVVAPPVAVVAPPVYAPVVTEAVVVRPFVRVRPFRRVVIFP
ncbi:MAG: hypothetical protein U0797_05500 [Gemmataceae bacterium]